MEAIAQRAGVSKVTLYKWWPNRAALVMDAFMDYGSSVLPYPSPMTAAQVQRQLGRMAQEFKGSTGRVVAELMAEAQYDDDVRTAFRDGYVKAKRQEGIRLIRSAIDAGVLRDVDPDIALDLMYAPLYFRLLVGHGPLTSDFVENHAKLVWRALAADSASVEEPE
ncbi:TetR/AcrR family transcriptional regulator C-terminal ligand-binding domain-containing protein [Dactylosporangium sp. CA-233914]|uniref:TetR/AcrR family transcriptional regulator n=1 Tax=Dactylosporangium sp. CA-233914 TaxID=3239934 RepID=UPI003D92B39D